MSARLAPFLRVVVAATLMCAPAMARPAKPAPNTGQPGSPGKSQRFTGQDVGPAADLDTTSLGKAAPASYEIGAPTIAPDRAEPVHRVMIFVHGGSWFT